MASTPAIEPHEHHAASGILLAIVSVDLIPGAFGTLDGWWLAAAFAAGGVTYILLQELVEWLEAASG